MMIKWYESDNMKIYLSSCPKITERYICPHCSDEEKKEILKKPYQNLQDISAHIDYFDKEYAFIIPEGYCFDGATIPRIFWRLIGSNTDNSFLIAAMVHDYMCEHHDVVDNNRYLSTLIFDALLKVGGTGKFKRWLMKHSVDNFQKFCGWGK